MLLDNNKEVKLPIFDEMRGDLKDWFPIIADKLLEHLPRYDRMERKKHLYSLIEHWINHNKKEVEV